MPDDILAFDGPGPLDEASWLGLLAMAAGRAVARPPDSGTGWWDLYAAIAGGQHESAFVVGQLGQSLDGRIATPTGRSHYINGPEALCHLHCLRALVDAVVIGIGTVLADDPRLTVRHTPAPHYPHTDPARVVIDPNGRLPPNAKVLADDGVPVFVVQTAPRPRPPSVTPIDIPARDGRLDPADIVAALAARGYRRILVEGGSRTLSAFLAAGQVDRLHLCVAPLVIGSGVAGISLPPIDRLDGALRPATTVHPLGRDVLFDCRLERRPTAAAALSIDTVQR